ncbi:MAG: FtsW/RodA/SpoVE family cell cycle protein [Spirochaetia bacterium]|nr:FtsW/RodA/SpoVE family cell cycle protein [Spirochaetia bacterium]
MNISRLDWVSVFFAISASVMGIFALYGGGEYGQSLAVKKMLWLTLGLILMLFLSQVNYQILGSYSTIIYGAALLLLIFTLVPFIGAKIKGARSWIRFFGIGFQPTEFAKIAFVIFLSKYLVLKETEIDKLKELILPFLITAAPVLLIALQPDLGSAIIFLPILFIMLFIGGANVSVIIGLLLIGFSVLFIPMFLEYHKYILVSDIVSYLKKVDYKLADAVRILNFEVWHYVENPSLVSEIKSTSAVGWSAKTIIQPENLALFGQAVEEVKKNNPSFFRDFFSNNITILIIIGSTAIIYGACYFLNYLSRTKWLKSISTISLIIFLSLSSTLIFRQAMSFKPHQVIRIVSFANPDKFPKGAGYQLRHSLITIGSGQIWGKGLLQGDMTRGDTPYLPEWYNDFVFSVIGEQFGFWGAALTILLLFGLVLRGVTIALQSKDDYGALLAGGLTSIFFFHIIINIGIAMGLFPVTGIPLVFISYGGSNMVASFAALGIILNISLRRFINV